MAESSTAPKKYTPAQKQKAMELADKIGLTVAAKKLKISASAIHGWRKAQLAQEEAPVHHKPPPQKQLDALMKLAAEKMQSEPRPSTGEPYISEVARECERLRKERDFYRDLAIKTNDLLAVYQRAKLNVIRTDANDPDGW